MVGMRVVSVIMGSMMISTEGRCCSKKSCTEGARASSEHAFQLHTVKGEGKEEQTTGRETRAERGGMLMGDRYMLLYTGIEYIGWNLNKLKHVHVYAQIM
jgi:hypothetical protein